MKTKVLSVRIDAETCDAFRHACWVLRKSQGEQVCKLVQEFTDRNWGEVERIQAALGEANYKEGQPCQSVNQNS